MINYIILINNTSNEYINIITRLQIINILINISLRYVSNMANLFLIRYMG